MYIQRSFFLDYPIYWNEKNMKIEYFLIILIILVTNSVHSMVFSDGLEHLDKLLQKSLRYKHHQLNYEESLHR